MWIATIKQTNSAEHAGGFLTMAIVAQYFIQMRKSVFNTLLILRSIYASMNE